LILNIFDEREQIGRVVINGRRFINE